MEQSTSKGQNHLTWCGINFFPHSHYQTSHLIGRNLTKINVSFIFKLHLKCSSWTEQLGTSPGFSYILSLEDWRETWGRKQPGERGVLLTLCWAGARGWEVGNRPTPVSIWVNQVTVFFTWPGAMEMKPAWGWWKLSLSAGAEKAHPDSEHCVKKPLTSKEDLHLKGWLTTQISKASALVQAVVFRALEKPLSNSFQENSTSLYKNDMPDVGALECTVACVHWLRVLDLFHCAPLLPRQLDADMIGRIVIGSKPIYCCNKLQNSWKS